MRGGVTEGVSGWGASEGVDPNWRSERRSKKGGGVGRLVEAWEDARAYNENKTNGRDRGREREGGGVSEGVRG